MQDDRNRDSQIVDLCGEPSAIGGEVNASQQKDSAGLEDYPGPVDYVVSLPERLVRTAAVAGGGLVLETSELVLPPPVRRSKIYQATIGRMVRITVEFVGGVTGRYAAETMAARDLATRKLAGNAVELASVLAVGFSPLWILAAASDITFGTRAYLDTFVKELKRTKVLAESAEISSVDDLLAVLENSSGLAADTIDIPPVSVNHMRASMNTLRQNVALIPAPRNLATIFAEMNNTAREQNRSLLTVSSLLAAGAIQSGLQLGNTHLFSFYVDALTTIRREGIPSYLTRISRPYITAATRHLNPDSSSHTQRLLRRLLRIAGSIYEKVRTPIQRIADNPRLELANRTWRELGDDYAVDLAASVSYYAVISLFPIVIGLATLSTFALDSDAGEQAIFGFLHSYLPGSHVVLSSNVEPLRDLRGTLGILSVLALILSSSMLFGALTRAVNRAWDIPHDRPFYKDKPLHFAMVFCIGPLFLASVAATTALQVAGSTGLPVHGYLTFVARDSINTLAHVLPLTLSLGMFLLIYKFAPIVPTSWRYIWPGAVLGALIFEVAKVVFSFYMENFAAYQRVYGALASLILLMVWIYVCGLIIIIGAEVSSEYERIHLKLGRGEPFPETPGQ